MRILTAIDRSEYAEIVLEHAFDQASRAGPVELHFVTLVNDDGDIEAARAWLAASVREGLATFAVSPTSVELHVHRGRPTPSIGALASELQPDLLVIGQFHVPSESDSILDLVECPVLVVGVDGHVLEPQCPACRAVRKATNAEQLFCLRHHSDRTTNLSSRLPPSTSIGSRLW
jgi:nucleotide-binding universal stress UspA family protein